MGNGAHGPGYSMRGALANDLFVLVRSTLPSVAEFMTVAHPDRGPGQVAAEVVVSEDPSAPRKRFVPAEYYIWVSWLSGTHAQVQINGATGSIDWSGSENQVLRAELRIFSEGAPESLGMFLRLLTSLLLPARRALLVHASAVATQGEGVVFLGESGAGKTTTARRVGREGALRFADDLVILHVGRENGVRVASCRFDRAGRLPGRENCCLPLRAAYDVRKDAATTLDAGRVKDSLATWCAAILSSAGPPDSLGSILSLAADLCRQVPPRVFNVKAAGPVLSALAGPSLQLSELRG